MNETDSRLRPLEYKEWTPAEDLSGHIAGYWRFRNVSAARECVYDHVIVPDGLASVTALYSAHELIGVMLMGPTTRALHVSVAQGHCSIGIRIRPGHAGALLGIDPVALVDRMLPSPQLASWVLQSLGDPQSIDRARLDIAASKLIDGKTGGDALVAAAADVWMDGASSRSVPSVATLLGVSERHLRRRFLQAAGMTPKCFSRVRRHRAAWVTAVNAEGESLAATAFDGGYADQAHFTREVRTLFGEPPRAIRDRLRTIEHHFAQSRPMDEPRLW